jgi:hypothetical protein
MSSPPKRPERLAEILQEILALSGSKRTNLSEPVSSDRGGLSEGQHSVDDESQRRDKEDDNRQTS